MKVCLGKCSELQSGVCKIEQQIGCRSWLEPVTPAFWDCSLVSLQALPANIEILSVHGHTNATADCKARSSALKKFNAFSLCQQGYADLPFLRT